MNFKRKLLFIFIAYGVMLVAVSQFLMFRYGEEYVKETNLEKASSVFEQKNEFFSFFMQEDVLKLSSVVQSERFHSFLKDPNSTYNYSEVTALFTNIVHTSKSIMQLRYIDAQGQEQIRVDRDSYGSKSYLVAKEKLQNKKNRYYFKKGMQVKEGEFTYSDIDLNIEHSQVGKPIKPVVRISTIVFSGEHKRGILIVNIFMKEFLKSLVKDASNDIYIFDGTGNVIADTLHQYCWSKYKKEENGVCSLPALDNRYLFKGKLSLDNGQELSMFVVPKVDMIDGEIGSIITEVFIILFVVVLLSLPIAYFFTRLPLKLKAEVEKKKEEQDILLSLFDLGDTLLFKWRNDEYLSVEFVSKSVEKLLSYTPEDFMSGSIGYEACIDKQDLSGVLAEIEEAIEKKVYFFEHKPYRVIAKEDEVKWILHRTVIIRDKKGEIVNFIGYISDISEVKNSELLLKKLAKTDQLTQIYNRMYIDKLLQMQYYRFQRLGEQCSIILLDIDLFKEVNDNYGHLVGDNVLVSFAKILRDTIRESDSVGRWGGEEFMVILPHTELQKAMLLAEKLRKAIEEYQFAEVGRKTASFGVATFQAGMNIEQLTNDADVALYKAKNDGRNRVETIQHIY